MWKYLFFVVRPRVTNILNALGVFAGKEKPDEGEPPVHYAGSDVPMKEEDYTGTDLQMFPSMAGWVITTGARICRCSLHYERYPEFIKRELELFTNSQQYKNVNIANFILTVSFNI